MGVNGHQPPFYTRVREMTNIAALMYVVRRRSADIQCNAVRRGIALSQGDQASWN